MERVYERKHQHSGGVIISAVAEDDTSGLCAVTVRLCPPDGRVLEVRLSEERCSFYSSLVEAQRAADEHVHDMIGHACAETCEQWPRALTH